MEKVVGIDLFGMVCEAENTELTRKEQEVQRRIKTLLDDIESLERTVKQRQKELGDKKVQLEKCRKGDWSAVPEQVSYKVALTDMSAVWNGSYWVTK